MAGIRILSANLWNGRADPEGFAHLLHTLQVDVAAVQELGPHQARAIAQVLPHGQLEPALDYSGMGLALRLPARSVRIPLRHRDARSAILSGQAWGLERPLRVINAHIAAPHVLPPMGGLSRRRIQMEDLVRFLQERSDERQVLVGDMNSTPLWPAYQALSRNLQDAASLLAQGRRRPRPTWGPWHRAPRLLRIDHGFVRGVRPLSFKVHGVPGSDHSAIVMDVSLDEP